MKICDELRQAVLQAAIQGKLTRQSKEDGDARGLLKQIAEEKAQLIKEKKIKKEKPLPEITEEEVPFDIPDNWEWCYVGDLFTHNTGKAMNSSAKNCDKQGSVRKFITTSNLYWNTFDMNVVKEMFFSDDELERCTVKKGDLLMCEGGAYYGRTAIWNFDYDICFQNHIHRLRPYVSLNLMYFYHMFHFYKNTGMMNAKGTAMPGLSSIVLHNMLVPLPPLAEQQRIVAKVEKLMTEIDELEKVENELIALKEAFPGDMKAALLQAAMQGELTTQRKEDGNAKELLKQITEEKARLVKEGKLKKEKPLAEISEDEIPFDIPENWKWVRLQSLLTVISDGTHKTPIYQTTGIPFLSVQNISSGKFDLSKVKYISEAEHSELAKRIKPQINDILFCRIGTLGKAIKCTLDFEFSIFVSLGLLRCVDTALADYLVIVINSPLGFNWIQENKVGGGTHTYKLNLSDLPNFIVPLPPLAEQERIVAKLDKLLPLCDSLVEA